MMKTNLYILSGMAALLLQSSIMTVDVRVAGNMVGSGDERAKDEMKVQDFDAFVFNVTSAGSTSPFTRMWKTASAAYMI